MILISFDIFLFCASIIPKFFFFFLLLFFRLFFFFFYSEIFNFFLSIWFSSIWVSYSINNRNSKCNTCYYCPNWQSQLP
ncbi:hypothetical protein DR095_01725 [Mycoplasma flocculare]|nr:hypothetical protein [Mesomycoplasma hyopneumoniae]MXR56110.1 hypothetical protein [Mesomycoplasma flocculare]